VKPPEYVLGMDAQLPGLGTNDFGEALIRGQVHLSNLVDQSALKLNCVTLVGDGGLSLLIPFGAAALRFDILAHLAIIEFLALLSDLLVDPIKFKLSDHHNWVGVLELVEKRSVLLDDGEDDLFGLWGDHCKVYGILTKHL
jgi:hypothetical protein